MADLVITSPNGVRTEVDLAPELVTKIGRAAFASLLEAAASPQTWQLIKAAVEAAEAVDLGDQAGGG